MSKVVEAVASENATLEKNQVLAKLDEPDENLSVKAYMMAVEMAKTMRPKPKIIKQPSNYKYVRPKERYMIKYLKLDGCQVDDDEHVYFESIS